MKTRDLIASEEVLWHAATHHPFLDGVRDGSLGPGAFSRWLVQDYHFALALTRAEARYLANAPREDFEVLVRGLEAMVAELAWFEEKRHKFSVFNRLQSKAIVAYLRYKSDISNWRRHDIDQALRQLDADRWIDSGNVGTDGLFNLVDRYLDHSARLHHPHYLAHQVAVPAVPSALAASVSG